MICKYCEKVEERCECDKYTNSLLDQIADLKHQLAEAHAAIKDIAEIVGDPACIRDGHIQRICEEVLREAGKK